MKRFIICFFILGIIFTSVVPTSFAITDEMLVAEGAVVIDGQTGKVLYEKNMNEQLYPASTTKIMTAILTIENAILSDEVIIDAETPFTGGSRIYVIEGEKFTVDQLLHALMLESANDAAVSLAKHVSGNVEEFAKLMNQKASEIGALNTQFNNPNGLPDEAHYTTAYDLALIGRYAMKNEKFRELVSTVSDQIQPTNKQEETRYLNNRNRFLWDTKKSLYYKGKYEPVKYDIVTGIKTGYTQVAGNCLVSSAMIDGREVIAVVLKSSGMNAFLDSRILLDYGLEQFKNMQLIEKNKIVERIDIKNGKEQQVEAVAESSWFETFSVDMDENAIEKKIVWRQDLEAPLEKDEVLGVMGFYYNNEMIGEINLIAKKTIEKSNIAAFKNKLGDIFSNMYILLLIPLLLVLLYFVWIIQSKVKRAKRRKKRRELIATNNDYIYKNILK